MSKTSAAKKARRKRRLAARNDRWLPGDVHADIEGLTHIANQIIPRGWEFDRELSSEDVITWYYPPSAIEVDDDDERTEAVTRIWISDPKEPHVILVGPDMVDEALTVARLFDRLETIEAYRAGDAEPDWG